MSLILLALAAALNAFCAFMGDDTGTARRAFNAAIAVFCLGLMIIVAPYQY